MVCSSWPSATRRQTDAIPLLSTPCADPTPLRLTVSYVTLPSPAAVVRLTGSCVLFSELTSILQPLSRLILNSTQIRTLFNSGGVQRPNNAQLVPWIIN